jgi:hypothetical protein
MSESEKKPIERGQVYRVLRCEYGYKRTVKVVEIRDTKVVVDSINETKGRTRRILVTKKHLLSSTFKLILHPGSVAIEPEAVPEAPADQASGVNGPSFPAEQVAA